MLHGSSSLFDPARLLPQEWRQQQARVSFASSASFSRKLSVQSAFVPAINPEQQPQPPPLSTPAPPTSGGSAARHSVPNPNPSLDGGSQSSARGKEWRVYANNNNNNGRWCKDDESALGKHEPLPLPMVYPGSTPDPQDVENMKNCDPEEKDCKDVLYQWTGKCSRCQGTGEVSYYRKKGREVICKCIPCMGLGYVHKMTIRTDIEVMEELDGAP